MAKQDIHNYEDILHLPHHVSTRHPQMARRNRAAQFAPFAALPGHREELSETARLTEAQKELDENKKTMLNMILTEIMVHIKEHPFVELTYFEQDERKAGGHYITLQAFVKAFDELHRSLKFTDGTLIRIDDIYDIRMIDMKEDAS